MTEWISAVLVLLGASTSLLAALGILRMPDFYSRLQTSAKASTLGIGCVVVAAAIEFEDAGTCARILLVGAFLALTTPVAAQMIARAAYAEDVDIWEGTIVDEMGGKVPDSSKASPSQEQ